MVEGSVTERESSVHQRGKAGPPPCSIHNCEAEVGYVIAGGGRRLEVCRKCMEEMTALFGWRFIGSVGEL